jgi:L-lactate permease
VAHCLAAALVDSPICLCKTSFVRIRQALVGYHMLIIVVMIDSEAVICTLSPHLPVLYAEFLLPSLCRHIGNRRHVGNKVHSTNCDK